VIQVIKVIKARLLDRAINIFVSVCYYNKASLGPNLPWSYPICIRKLCQ